MLHASTPPNLHVSSGLDLSTFDRRVRPQDDLFHFVNGAWIARADIPAERVSITTFTELVDQADLDVRAIIEEIPARGNARPGSIAQQVADLYASMMNDARIEALDDAPMAPELRKIDAIRSTRDLAAEAGYLSSIGMGGPFPGTVGADARDPTRTVVQISQGGILLPDRDHYLSAAPALALVREQYAAYLQTIFTLTRRADPRGDAAAVLALETAIARAEWTAADRRDPGGTPQRYDLGQLGQQMPGFDWAAWAHPQGLDRPASLVLAQPSFFRAFAALVPATPLDAWKAWLAARYITASAPYVGHRFSDARFEFFGRTLTGQQAPVARWKRGVGLVNAVLGQAVGRLYVERHFPAAAKVRAQKIVSRLLDEYRRALAGLDWMSPSTRSEAQRKLARLTAKIGYPDVWRDYQGLVIKPDDLVGNLQRAQQFDNVWRMSRLAAEDGAEWPMTPQTVNAFYSPALNGVVVPAAMLQPPLFTPDAEDAVNYGAIGAVIGHEIGHAFDEQGRRFDASRAVRSWWADADERAYRLRTRQLVEALNAIVLTGGGRLDGDLLLPESLGDLAGLTIAYRAYQRSLGGTRAPVLDGFTGDQRFFLGWAQVWRSRVRPEYEREQAATSRYPPADVRANLPLGHLPAFVEAFGVQPGDALYRAPGDRARIW